MQHKHRRQLHVWLTEEEYLFLLRFAERRREPVGVVVRRIVNRLRENSQPDGDPEAPARPNRWRACLSA
jgi:hypothetical protein